MQKCQRIEHGRRNDKSVITTRVYTRTKMTYKVEYQNCILKGMLIANEYLTNWWVHMRDTHNNKCTLAVQTLKLLGILLLLNYL